ncbi:hypothetical protein GEV33_005222 [Tenebrio molitor]|jgi:hypothetical protein|uniref:Uncharacterized protein n=1 Tax=Tenebrio molitor TaxID=7067 RepID=A0A8J6HEZ9_TENMO|nr:hypothetical protein GEV33_005222 [Tenebrio molitor]
MSAEEEVLDPDPSSLYEDLLERHIEKRVCAVLAKKYARLREEPERMDLGVEDRVTPSTSSGARGDILPAFDPDDQGNVVDAWLKKIDQLGEIHKWAEYDYIFCFMQQKLSTRCRSRVVWALRKLWQNVDRVEGRAKTSFFPLRGSSNIVGRNEKEETIRREIDPLLPRKACTDPTMSLGRFLVLSKDYRWNYRPTRERINATPSTNCMLVS